MKSKICKTPKKLYAVDIVRFDLKSTSRLSLRIYSIKI